MAAEVAEEIMAASPPAGFAIEATDVDVRFLDELRAKVERRQWPVTMTEMPAERLKFEDDKFTHSIANFLIFITPSDGIPAIRHTYRTLRPGGVAAFTSWKYLPHWEVISAVHDAVRPDAKQRPLCQIPPMWFEGEYMMGQVIKGGFDEAKVRTTTTDVHLFETELPKLAGIIWSYLGRSVSGWIEEDERRWDEAIEAILERFQTTEGFSETGNGKTRITLVANVVIATK